VETRSAQVADRRPNNYLLASTYQDPGKVAKHTVRRSEIWHLAARGVGRSEGREQHAPQGFDRPVNGYGGRVQRGVWQYKERPLAGGHPWSDERTRRSTGCSAGVGDQALSSAGFAMLGMASGN
jgi:hypothetical protein